MVDHTGKVFEVVCKFMVPLADCIETDSLVIHMGLVYEDHCKLMASMGLHSQMVLKELSNLMAFLDQSK